MGLRAFLRKVKMQRIGIPNSAELAGLMGLGGGLMGLVGHLKLHLIPLCQVLQAQPLQPLGMEHQVCSPLTWLDEAKVVLQHAHLQDRHSSMIKGVKEETLIILGSKVG